MTSETKQIELDLFLAIAEKVIESGGAIENADGFAWRKTPRGEYIRSQSRVDGDTAPRAWSDRGAAMCDLARATQGNINKATLYVGDSTIGVTWRMLKIDMSYLRIVLSPDAEVAKTILGEITSRLYAMINQAMIGEDHDRN